MNPNFKRKIKSITWFNYLYILIPLVLIILFYLIPFIRTIFLSFTKYNGFSDPVFVGIKNYLFLFKHAHFLNALKNNFIIALTTPIRIIIPLILAIILFQNQGRLLNFARMSIMLPYAISMTIVGIMFRSFFSFDGAINQILRNIGLDFVAIDWFNSYPNSMSIIVITMIWYAFGYNTVIFLAGLSTINQDLLDAAKIDGANWWQEVRFVIIPQLNPIIVFLVALGLISNFKSLFDFVYNITFGGPGFKTQTIEFLLYQEGFLFLNMGFACVIGLIMFVIIIILTRLQMKFMTRED